MPQFINDNIYYILGSDSFLYQRTRQANNFGNAQIVVLGASHAYRGVDPREFAKHGITIFNLGSSSQTPLQTQILVQKYINKLKPKIVLYEVYPEMFDLDGVESSLDFLANTKIDCRTVKMCIKVNSIKTYLTLIYNSVRQITGIDKNAIIPDTILNDNYISGGFVQKKQAFFIAPQKTNARTLKIRQKQIKAFNNIIDTLKHNVETVILFQAPVTKHELNNIQNYWYFDTLFKKYNLPYYNFNSTNSLPDSCFFDSNHLNNYGTAMFNAELINVLINNKHITNRQ